MRLRDRGIYVLPNDRELVVFSGHENGAIAYTLGGWEGFEMVEYEVNEAGRLVFQGKVTAWDIADLKDTGRTVSRELAHQADQHLSREGLHQHE